MAEEIEIIVTTQGFDKVQTGLKQTSDQLGKTANEAKKTGDALKNNLQTGSNQASQSLTNLSRIAQDAPFGFIGIANNINPLVESFGRLKQETGSTGGALKALVSGLSGPGGLGLAFGVVTAAISFAQMGFQAWTRSAQKTKETVDEIKKAQEDFAKSLDTSKASALSSGIALQNYVDVAKNSTLPIEQRNEALKKANDILGQHGKLLTLTTIATSEGTKEIELYTKAIIAQAVATQYTNQIAQATINEIRLKKELTDAQNKLNIAQAEQVRAAIAGREAARAGAIMSSIGAEQNRNYAAALNKVNEIQLKLTNTQNLIKSSTEEAKLATIAATSAFGELGTKTKDSKKNVETLDEALAKFEKTLIAIQATGTSLGTPQFDINTDKIKEFESILKNIIEKFNVDPTNKIYLGLEARVNELQFDNFIQGIIDKINAQAPKLKIKFEPVNEEPVPDVKFSQAYKDYKARLIRDAEEAKRLAAQKLEEFQSIIKNFAQESAAQIGVLLGEGLFAAITGQADGFRKAFAGLFTIFGDAVISLGKYAILYSSAIQALKKSIAKAGISGIGIGIGLIALGTLIRAAASGIGRAGAFAVGTRNAPGGMALVGERGPELVNLPGGSQVIPATQTAQMLGGAGGRVEVYGVLRGQDIFFSNRKYSQTYNRQT